jgi:signal transduction histidine kinase
MDTPPLHQLLEEEKASALLANFAQLFSGALHVWLVDVAGHLVGYHPISARDADPQPLVSTLHQVQRAGRSLPLPDGFAVPVWLRGKAAGALVAATSDPMEPHRAAAFLLLARVISLLAENRLTQEDLLQETLDRYRELNLLYRAGETIAANLDLGRVNRLILDETTRLVQADEGALLLVDRQTGRLTVWASQGMDAVADIGAGLPLGHEVAELVARSGRTQVFTQPGPRSAEKGLSSLLCVPLKTKDAVLGVISLALTDSNRRFRANDISLINALAGQAAIAIDNALMFSDLTALHNQLEAANRRLLELDRLKSSFLGVVTHELRSPFANIDFSLQLIERYGTQTWLQAQQEQWSQLVDAVQEAKGMIDNLVSFAGLLVRQGDLSLTDVDFAQLVREVADTLRMVTPSRRIKLSVAGDDGIPSIQADRERLGDAIYHLIHNGIKFNRPGGSVQVRYGAEEAGVWFEVQDSGVGIPQEKINGVWDPFSQLADPLRRGREGLGLGLALVRYVIRAHGGHVGVSSEEGVGSTFRFWLPVTSVAHTAPDTGLWPEDG